MLTAAIMCCKDACRIEGRRHNDVYWRSGVRWSHSHHAGVALRRPKATG